MFSINVTCQQPSQVQIPQKFTLFYSKRTPHVSRDTFVSGRTGRHKQLLSGPGYDKIDAPSLTPTGHIFFLFLLRLTSNPKCHVRNKLVTPPPLKGRESYP